ncbi:uncharacterized protein LOC109860420 [Pseudomyrmex gracilis]|uniref:uncharacterized protein LOC109860420 n=1 Tax=Pseudomyrmex gracilis TaxID=219809 RepID=UPI000994FEB0|nr:uncharacterized protein LOC109860420 [Pseudomyrmex gracilis]
MSSGVYCCKPEYIIAEISFSRAANLLLAVVYRPPNCGFLQEFETEFLDLQATYRHSVIFGDFNADLLSISYDSAHLTTFVESSGLYLVPYRATHNLMNSSTLLDLCIVDDMDKINDFGQHDVPFLSAHDLIYIEYKILTERMQERETTFRDFRNFDETAFIRDILRIDWSDLDSSVSLDDKVDILNQCLLQCVNKHAPLRRGRFKNLPAPWLSLDIKNAMRRRDKARRKWRRDHKVESYDIFKRLRNDVQRSVRTAKNDYYLSIFSNKSSGATWTELRRLGLIQSKAGMNKRLSNTTDELNCYFAHVAGGPGGAGVGQVMEFPDVNMMSDAFDDRRLHWKYVTPQDIYRVFSNIKSNATGSDGISVKIIKFILPYIMPIIEHIYNFSLSHGYFPECWKRSVICPVPKIKDPTMPKHYRPIAILPTLSKALERIVCDQVRDYLEENDLWDQFQFAYKKGHSTETSVIRILDDVRWAADKRMVTIAVLFDFSKAFDRVQHWILLQKLTKYNFSYHALLWIRSYLEGRSQLVKDPFSQEWSSPVDITAGVPQGSVLGPLLFVLYLGDFAKLLSHCKYSFYADDLVLYLHCEPRELSHGIAKVNSDITNSLDFTQ